MRKVVIVSREQFNFLQQNLYLLHVSPAGGKFVLLQVMFIPIQFNSVYFLSIVLNYSLLDCCLQYKRFYCWSIVSKFSFGFLVGHHNTSDVSLEYIQAISRLLSDFTQSVVSIHVIFNNLICLRQV